MKPHVFLGKRKGSLSMLNNTVCLLNYFIMRKTDIMTISNSSAPLIASAHYLCLQSFHRRERPVISAIS